MKLIHVFFLAMTMMVFGACNNSAKEAENTKQIEEQQALWDEMMVLHDETMKMVPDLENVMETLKGVISNENYVDTKPAAEMAFKEAEKANSAMWDWMHNLVKLEDLRKDKNHEEIITHLKEQKASMETIAKEIRESGLKGESIYENLFGQEKN